MQKILNKFERIFEKIHVYNHVRNETFFENYQLSHNIEYQLTQNLTFIAVYEKNVYIVFATTIENTIAQNDFIFNIVINSKIEFFVKKILFEIEKYLKQCARKNIIVANQLFVY